MYKKLSLQPPPPLSVQRNRSTQANDKAVRGKLNDVWNKTLHTRWQDLKHADRYKKELLKPSLPSSFCYSSSFLSSSSLVPATPKRENLPCRPLPPPWSLLHQSDASHTGERWDKARGSRRRPETFDAGSPDHVHTQPLVDVRSATRVTHHTSREPLKHKALRYIFLFL